MATLRDIKTRIKSVRQIQKITAAMKMVAAARLRKLQQAQERFQPFEKALGDLCEPMRRLVRVQDHPFLQERPGANVWMIVLTSERGLCGAYDHNIENAARKFIRQSGSKKVSLLVAGRKGLSYFRNRGYQLLEIDWPEGVERRCKKLAFFLRKSYLSGEVDEVHVIYDRLQLDRVRGIKVVRVLPLPEPSPEEVTSPVRLSSCLMEPGFDGVFARLTEMIIFRQLYTYLLDAAAGEEFARMNAMEQATDNADDLIFNLTLAFNKARQEAITTELMDILGGAQVA